ncbi:MAG: hypothetical protein IPM79_16910 [Polyangiaceae bacterium]|nr:hypothetical protein [Polyangiaceae bacterium]
MSATSHPGRAALGSGDGPRAPAAKNGAAATPDGGPSSCIGETLAPPCEGGAIGLRGGPPGCPI